jgi:hypothetical protein
MKEIEGKEHNSMWRLVDGRAERIEVRNAVLVLDDYLTVEYGSRAGELAASLHHPTIWSGPVPPMAREGSDGALVGDDKGAVAVVLDLMNPALPGGWFRHGCRDFRPYEAERGRR